MWRRTVCLVNTSVSTDGGCFPTIRFASRVLSVGAPPERGDEIVDLNGAHVLPGLVNAHDHLELNHFGRLKFRARYESVSEWIDDMRPRLHSDPHIRESRSHSLSDRLFHGGLKNVFSGVTTVAHHNPLYRELKRSFPVRLVRRFGWAHSFFLSGQPVGARGEQATDMKRAFDATPRGAPFLVHIAEGVDAGSREELRRLHELGCLSDNTVLVHGVGFSTGDWRLARSKGAGLVWCPSSNLFLFERTASVEAFVADNGQPALRQPLCLGTDSRLTGSRDLLEELRVARSAAPSLGPNELLHMVTAAPAKLLRAPWAGRLTPGAPADLIAVPRHDESPAEALIATRRNDLLLVTKSGRPMVAVPELSCVFAARSVGAHPGELDGKPRLFDAVLARRMARSALAEEGVRLSKHASA
jgi:cytosine/adenosine deaminase-related metal-dependent hydrolase